MKDVFSERRILQLKTAFITYNISRLRELIRYLPPKKFELFQRIPLWLHVNQPGIPGYLDSPQTPCGIFRFHTSGFWREAVRRFKGKEKEVYDRPVTKGRVLGMYLMGSSGTLAQTDKSDFDYWIVVDSEGLDAEARSLFQEKINRIETWSRHRYDQEVKLFVLHPADVRENEFSAVDEDSSGSAQRSFLKEEFYRTFIMIAGQIPFWAVTPVGLSDLEYDQWIEQASALQSRTDYIDLGNLKDIDRQECLGAILWQLFKARKYPVKSLIKAGLVAYYFFSPEKQGLLCDQIRHRFSDGSPGNALIDPYAIVFKTVIDFFQSIEDAQGLLLIKDCIFLRLSETSKFEQAGSQSPKQELLKRYLAQWQWTPEKIEKMATYRNWPESERLSFEERLLRKITFLYELILRAHGEAVPNVSMKPSDLLSLKNNISAAFKKKPGKLPPCSAFLRTHGTELTLQIRGYMDDAGRASWTVHNQPGKALDARHAVFKGPELLRTLGWVLANGFYPDGVKRIEFQTFNLPLNYRRAGELLGQVFRFFSDRPVNVTGRGEPPKWERMAVLLHCLPDRVDEGVGGAELLVVNSWGEIFFESVALSHISGIPSRCYKISEYIWKYNKRAKAEKIGYCLLELGKPPEERLVRLIESGLNSFMRSIPVLRQLDRNAVDADAETEEPPLLDLL
jgi:adenylate cyclase, class 1